MNDFKSGLGRGGANGRKNRNIHTTRSGKTIKVHRNLTERFQASRDAKAQRKALRMAGLPKSRVKRILYMMQPRRMYNYWFSRDGLIMALRITGIGIVVCFLFLIGIFAYFRKDLPNLRDISGSSIGGSIRYYDKTGQTLLWEDYDGVKRVPVKGEEISQYLKDATIAIEDQDFFKHGGFDTRGIARAAVNDVFGSGGRQGGSTITQQLVKLNNDWTNERTVTIKVKELILAVELERSYSKQEILTGYLNAAPYGNVQYGAEAASRDYFQKSAKDLTLDEAAFLAAIPKSPSLYSPYGAYYKQNPEDGRSEAEGRQHYILDQMLNQGKITKKQHQEAKKTDTIAKVKQPKLKFDGIMAPYFVLAAKDQLETQYGPDSSQRGGWKVTTTLDLTLQQLAEQSVQKGMTQVRRQGGDTAAFAAEDVKTGQVVALVGGVDFNNEKFGQNNYAHDLLLPPGSTFKPYDYAALIEHTTNFGAGSVLYDTQGPLDGYPCTTGPRRDGNCAIDYDLRYPGPVTLRYALGGSRNVPAMKAMLTVGVDKTIGTAKKMMRSPGTSAGEARGDYKCYADDELAKEAPCYTAASIGDGAYLRLDDNVHGYATLSRNGLNIPQTYILKIEKADGGTISEWKPSKGEQAVRPDTAYIVADMLSDPNASYLTTKSHNYKGWKFGFKTGTTNDNKDGWMMGFSTQYAVGTWVGYHDRTKAMTGFMENMTQPIVTNFMQKAHDPLKPEERSRPSGIKVLPAFVVRNHVGVGSREPSPATDLFPSWYEQKKTNSTAQTIDKISNKLATDCTPGRAKQEVSGTSASSLSGDRFVTGSNAVNLTEKDDVHKCEDEKPRITQLSVSGTSVFISVAAGTHPLAGNGDKGGGKINLQIDGQTAQTIDMDGRTDYTVTAPSVNGTKTLTVEIIDSVLYDASASTEITGSSSSSGGSNGLTMAAPVKSGNTVTFSWMGGTGPYTVRREDTGTTLCTAKVNENSCSTVSAAATNGTKVTVSDSTGQRSAEREV